MTDRLEPSAVMWRHDGVTWRVVLRWGDVDGFVECVGVELTHDEEARPLTAAVVRALPFGGLVREARNARYEASWGPVMEAVAGTDEEALLPPGVDREARSWTDRPVRRAAQLDGDHYEAVARIYSHAADRGESPRKAVAETMHVSPPTASRWIGEARRRALLPPTTPGKARATTPVTEEVR
jgi:hypothetical protein